MPSRFQATLPGTAVGVRRLRHELTGMAEDCGMDPQAVADVQLAVTEAATNAVVHAYAEAEGELSVCAAMGGGELTVVIRDTGPGMEHGGGRPGLGAGLSLIATVAARLRIVSRPGGTEVHMAFPCPASR